MRIIAKRNDSWHNLSNIYGQDNKAVYTQDTNFVKLKDTKYWEKYRRSTVGIEGRFHHTALVLIGDYAYPVSIISNTVVGWLSVWDNGLLSTSHQYFTFEALDQSHWYAYRGAANALLPDKMDNPEPEVKFGIIFLDGSRNVTLWKDPVINSLPKHNGFYTMFPPEFIWQEIAMSLSKDLEVPSAVTNDVKIQQAGFDLKTSFRGK